MTLWKEQRERLSDNEDNPPPPDRESVWSIPVRWQTAYFTLFALQNIVGISLVCWYEIAIRTEDDAVLTILNIIDRISRMAVGAAAITITLMEVARIVMVIGGNLERWLRKREDERVDKAVAEVVAEVVAEATAEAAAEAAAKARSEALNEAQLRWSEWNQRRLDAEARGEPFTEPPPDLPSDGRSEA